MHMDTITNLFEGSEIRSICGSEKEDYMYTEIDESGLGAMMWCAKKTNKITKVGCPNGYTQSDNVCKKTEVLSCTIN